MKVCKTCNKVYNSIFSNCDMQTTNSEGRTFRCGGILRSLQEGDLLDWTWLSPWSESFEPYWAKARIVIVIEDGRWIDTWSHYLNDTKNCWSTNFVVEPERVTAAFLINVANLTSLVGPREQYSAEDTFHLCNGGGGSWRDFMRKDAKPQKDLVLKVLEGRLAHSRSEVASEIRRQ